jgi:histidinol dehydrogenase
VAARGDEAVLEFTAKFDGAQLTADQLAVTQAELFNASLTADESLRAAVAEAEKNIAGFAKKSKRKGWRAKIPTARPSAKNLIRSSASAFTFPAAPRRWSPRR